MTGEFERALAMTRAVAAALIGATQELCALDSVAGDGDHGLAMSAASHGIIARLEASPPSDMAGLFAVLADEFAAVGGSMGALLTVALESAGAAVLAPRPSGGEPAFATAVLGAAQDAVSELGGAKPGDKSLLDAMDAARRRAAALPPSIGAPELLRLLAEAAREGATATAKMPATIGRASRLGDKSLGSPDAGATSFAIAMAAIANA